MDKLAENDLTYFYLRHVVIVVTAVTTISLPPVNNIDIYLALTAWYVNHFNELCKFKEVS
jgi:hypothetical protein